MNRCRWTLVAMLVTLPSIGRGATGDVSFRIPDRVWNRDQSGLALSLDVFVDVESQTSVPAIGWGTVVTIAPQPGAVGSVVFAPSTIVGDLPNLSPASTSPFLDFDRDEGGMAYGETTTSPTELEVFSTYVEPVVASTPTVDGNGNLTLPNGAGLVALPISVSADALGSFLVSFDANPAVTGIVYATGLAEPNDIGVHPVGSHVAGLLSIVNLAGDYNFDGSVDAADYVSWRKNPGGFGGQQGYDDWRSNFGQTLGSGALSSRTVPEPLTAILIVFAAAMEICKRRRFDSRVPATPWRVSPINSPRSNRIVPSG
jgi:hypothetical protein